MGSEGLVRLAWLHMWMFEDNLLFIKKDFGRSFRPQGSDAELEKYGDLIADRMMSYSLPESTPEARRSLDEIYINLLRLFEIHFSTYPYLLGGHPCAGDYAIMGALHAHMGRDPAGLRIMQKHGPRVLRWVENMLLPEVQAPEFHDFKVNYPADDHVPDSALETLRFIAGQYGMKFVLGAKAFNQAMHVLQPASGFALAPQQDQPVLPLQTVVYQG
jgi:hypothetical protein